MTKKLTVCELIKKLEKFDGDLEVRVFSDMYDIVAQEVSLYESQGKNTVLIAGYSETIE